MDKPNSPPLPLPVATNIAAIEPAEGYAGNIPLAFAHQWWLSGQAVLVDVRTQAEREWVGYVPGTACIPWKHYPGMAINPDFDAALLAQVPRDSPLILLCRSGVRSIGAARRACELGYGRAYNILDGFEGDPDADQQRGHINGWRHAGFPWVQG